MFPFLFSFWVICFTFFYSTVLLSWIKTFESRPHKPDETIESPIRLNYGASIMKVKVQNVMDSIIILHLWLGNFYISTSDGCYKCIKRKCGASIFNLVGFSSFFFQKNKSAGMVPRHFYRRVLSLHTTPLSCKGLHYSYVDTETKVSSSVSGFKNMFSLNKRLSSQVLTILPSIAEYFWSRL